MKGLEISKNIGDVVYDVCRERGIKVRDVEKATNLSRGYISRCRKGTKRLSAESIIMLSNYLKVNLFRESGIDLRITLGKF